MVKSSANELNEAFYNGQIVWLKVNPEVSGMVTGVVTRPGGSIQYLVTNSTDLEERFHFPCELSAERPTPYGNDT